MNLETVRAIAETGVDVISVGALTHSVRGRWTSGSTSDSAADAVPRLRGDIAGAAGGGRGDAAVSHRRFGNPSSHHTAGEDAAAALADARARWPRRRHARRGHHLHRGGGTEADNLAIKGIALAAMLRAAPGTSSPPPPSMKRSSNPAGTSSGCMASDHRVRSTPRIVRPDAVAAALRARPTS